MKVFLSWSGKPNQAVAEAFRDWLPFVLPFVEPYVSSEDIDKGARWAADIAKELEESSYGVLCLTPDNLHAPWLLFEAGALSKFIDRSRVVPLLLNVKKSELHGPLLQFQATTWTKKDIKKLIHGINDVGEDNSVEKSRVDTAFDVWWSKLDEIVKNIDVSKSSSDEELSKPLKSDSEKFAASEPILEEILELCRNQIKLLHSPEEVLPSSYLLQIIKGPLMAEFGKDFVPIEHDHPAWADLDEGFSELENFAKSIDVDEVDEIPSDEVQNLIDLIIRIRGPVKFIVGKTRMQPSRIRRFARSGRIRLK